MREIHITLAGKPFTLRATFAASMEIAETVADPIFMIKEISQEASFAEAGLPYSPNFELNVYNIPQVLWIGAKAAGNKITLEEMNELVFETGFYECRGHAISYITKMVS